MSRNTCPGCSSENYVGWEDVNDIDADSVEIECGCRECGYTWNATYHYREPETQEQIPTTTPNLAELLRTAAS